MFRIIFVGDVRSENLKLFTRMSHDKILQAYNDIKHQAERLASRDEFPALVSRRLAIIKNN